MTTLMFHLKISACHISLQHSIIKHRYEADHVICNQEYVYDDVGHIASCYCNTNTMQRHSRISNVFFGIDAAINPPHVGTGYVLYVVCSIEGVMLLQVNNFIWLILTWM